MAILSLQNINFSYGSAKVLKDISYDFEKGKTYCIVGKSGAGRPPCSLCSRVWLLRKAVRYSTTARISQR